MWTNTTNGSYFLNFNLLINLADFFKKKKGFIILFSLKNPNYYEQKFEFETGCMCLDFHSDYPYLLAAGFYNGTVKVFDLRKSHLIKQHIILMNENSQKHYDPVWQVKWQKDDIYDRKNFYSISSDGKMINWTLINVILIKFLLK